ncbi:MAG: hypothetical protein IH988_09595 [Planctomycetes bacterium]|nr:hypothetical protein [Planctomycetota bacterium]
MNAQIRFPMRHLQRTCVQAVVCGCMIIGPSPLLAEGHAWTELPSLPITVSNNAVTSVDNGDRTTAIYSFMGIINPLDEDTITPLSFRMTLPDGEWESIADAPLLNGLGKIGANAVTVAGEVYLIGGYSVDGFSETTEHRLFRYDVDADSYVELAEIFFEVDDTVTGVYQDRYLYTISGWHGPSNDNIRFVQVYDTQTDDWSLASSIEQPLPGLFGHAGTIIGDRIVYMDGVNTAGGFVISDRVFVGQIDPEKVGDVTEIEWLEVDPHPGLPTYRAAGSQGGTGDERLLLVGGTDNPYNFDGMGYNGDPSFPLDQILTYDPSTEEWETIIAEGKRPPTMDHRGLVRAGDTWVIVGGMTAPGATTDQVWQLTLGPTSLPGDLDGNGVVNLADYAVFQGCFTGPGGGPVDRECIAGDSDLDGDIDLIDFGAFQRAFAGR